jgi:hypothetical protein
MPGAGGRLPLSLTIRFGDDYIHCHSGGRAKAYLVTRLAMATTFKRRLLSINMLCQADSWQYTLSRIKPE